MSEAINNPVRRNRGTSNTDFNQSQLEPVNLALGEDLDSQIIIADTGTLIKEYAAALSFNEEPVTVIINRDTGKNPAPMVPCWCDGKGAEALSNGKWITLGWLPTGKEVTTKRKYLEILLRSKPINYTTEVTQFKDHEINQAVPHISSSHQISVLHDANPLGREWLSRVMWEK